MRNQLPLSLNADKRDHIPWLDGMRGLAILLVGTGHFFYEIYFFKITWVGLNLFFVLSGYLITRTLFEYKNYSTGNYFLNFYGRRMLRIFPLYYGILIFFFLILPLVSDQLYSYYQGLDNIQEVYWLYTSNWNIISNGLPEQPLFFHFWSLAVEEQFYFIWPALFLFCNSSKSKYILITLLLLLSAITRISTVHPLHAYLSSLTAAEPLLLGCLLCVLQEDGMLKQLSRKLTIAVGLAVIFLSLVFIRDQDLSTNNTWLIKYGYSAVNIILAGVIAAALIGRSFGVFIKNLFSAYWLRWLGIYSYSLYVFHWLILKTLVYKMEVVFTLNHWPVSLSYLVPRLIGIVLTLFAGYFSYHYFEKHLLSLKKYFSGNRSWNWSSGWKYVFHKRTKPAGN